MYVYTNHHKIVDQLGVAPHAHQVERTIARGDVSGHITPSTDQSSSHRATFPVGCAAEARSMLSMASVALEIHLEGNASFYKSVHLYRRCLLLRLRAEVFTRIITTLLVRNASRLTVSDSYATRAKSPSIVAPKGGSMSHAVHWLVVADLRVTSTSLLPM